VAKVAGRDAMIQSSISLAETTFSWFLAEGFHVLE
jgi:hypothetical protein